MNIYVSFISVLVACTAATTQDSNSYWTIFHPAETMRAFIDAKTNVENVINSSYDNAKKMKDSVSNYVREQKRKMSNEINNYVETVKESGRKVAETWSFLPNDKLEPESQLENPDVVLSVPAIISRNGYICETHTVISEGYVLNIHRIPSSATGGVSKKTILLQHGLFASSADWILNGPEKGLAYVLSNAGYDVWMTNIRANKYSREHTTLKTNSKSYWNFSWHDVALYDIPNVIDYILKVKGSDTKITYIGHSMGTTILFAMLTLRPEYNDILSAGFALAPVVFMSDLKSPITSFASITSNVAQMEMLYGSYEFVPKDSSLGRITKSCHDEHVDFALCKNALFYICGYNEKQFNKAILPVFLSHLGTGTSWKTAVHFTQEIVSGGNFQQFDYGAYNNLKIYGSESPPEYDLSKITLPITLFWSQNDLLSSEKDVKKLYEVLPSSTESYLVPDPGFNHLDYLWAIDAPRLLNNKILDFLKKIYDERNSSFDQRFVK